MSQNNTTTSSAIFIMVTSALALTGGSTQSFYMDEEFSVQQMGGWKGNENASDTPIAAYRRVAKDITRAVSESESIDRNTEEILLRFERIKSSFDKHNAGFPADKTEYFSALANTVCLLNFKDNISEYNEYDETIDTVLKLANGQTLSISQFLSEEVEAPVVFSIHRGKELLVSDEMPLRELVNTISFTMEKS